MLNVEAWMGVRFRGFRLQRLQRVPTLLRPAGCGVQKVNLVPILFASVGPPAGEAVPHDVQMPAWATHSPVPGASLDQSIPLDKVRFR